MNKIRGYRNMFGVTQSEMAKFLNINVTSYRNKENGKLQFKENEMKLIKEKFLSVGIELTLDEIFL